MSSDLCEGKTKEFYKKDHQGITGLDIYCSINEVVIFFLIILFMTSALKNDVNTTELSIFLWTSIRNLVYSLRDGDIKADWQTERNIIPKSISFLVYSEDSPQVWNSTL